jgi:hypothetical protein
MKLVYVGGIAVGMATHTGLTNSAFVCPVSNYNFAGAGGLSAFRIPDK